MQSKEDIEAKLRIQGELFELLRAQPQSMFTDKDIEMARNVRKAEIAGWVEALNWVLYQSGSVF